MTPPYTFDNWINGEICLLSSSTGLLLKGEKMPIQARWAEIKRSDVVKIRQKQKEIFERSVKIILEKLLKQFESNSKSTISKEGLLDRLILKFEEILYDGVHDNKTHVTLKTDNTVFEYNHYVGIKNYVSNYILLSKRNKSVFIHAISCKLYHLDFVYPQVEAEAYFRFLTWLKEKKLNLNNQEEVIINKKNWRDDIFKDEQHYKKGLEIIGKLVNNKSKVSTHSFVYHVFRKNDFLKDFKHKVYIQFLAEEYSVEIKGVKISSKKPAYLIDCLKLEFPGLDYH